MILNNTKVVFVSLVVLLLLLSTIVLGTDSNYKPGSEPDGFRGIKWGTNIATLKDMQLSGYDGKGKIYIRKGDKLTIGKAQLTNIEYSFYNDTFDAVKIVANGNSNYTALIDVFTYTFGKVMTNNDVWLWMGKITLMMLKYDKSKEIATVLMFSKDQLNKAVLKEKGF